MIICRYKAYTQKGLTFSKNNMTTIQPANLAVKGKHQISEERAALARLKQQQKYERRILTMRWRLWWWRTASGEKVKSPDHKPFSAWIRMREADNLAKGSQDRRQIKCRRTWEPLVSLPALAMESLPGLSCFRTKFSSWNFVPASWVTWEISHQMLIDNWPVLHKGAILSHKHVVLHRGQHNICALHLKDNYRQHYWIYHRCSLLPVHCPLWSLRLAARRWRLRSSAGFKRLVDNIVACKIWFWLNKASPNCYQHELWNNPAQQRSSCQMEVLQGLNGSKIACVWQKHRSPTCGMKTPA